MIPKDSPEERDNKKTLSVINEDRTDAHGPFHPWADFILRLIINQRYSLTAFIYFLFSGISHRKPAYGNL